MQHTESQSAYSYRDDPSVPEFDDRGPITFMDGDCVLCTTGARLIARFDGTQEFKICPVQSTLGQAVLRHFGVDAGSPETWLYLVDGRAYTSIDAMIRVGKRIGGWGLILLPLRLVPGPVLDWIYRRIARNRYRVFGRTDMCAAADQNLRNRLIG